jgi:hypothetical protein
MPIENLIKDSYNDIKSKDTNLKSEIYFSIIQIKSENPDFVNIEQSMYKDIKLFILNYVNSVEKKDFGYDFIDIKKIITSIELETSSNAKYELYSFSIRLLKSKNHDNLIDELLKKRVLAKFELTLCEKKWYSWIKAILVISTYNFFSILLSLFFLSLIGMLLMQSCFIDAFGIFNFEFDVFSENQIINEFLNIIAKPLGLAENFKIIPKNAIATLLLIFFKCIYLLIAVNFMFEKIKDNLIR